MRMQSRQPPDGSPFEYDPETKAIIVRQGDSLVWSEFGEGVWRPLRHRFGATAGDWRVWTIWDRDYDDAIVVKAEIMSWPVSASPEVSR